MITHDRVLRSIGAAALLRLAGKDPLTQFADYGAMALANDRRSYAYEGQAHAVTYGGYEKDLVPGLVVATGAATVNRRAVESSLVVSINRLIENSSCEIEMRYCYDLGARLAPMVYESQEAPIYEFATLTDSITAVAGMVRWGEAIRFERPTERPVEYDEAGGWVRLEYRFRIRYYR